MTTYTTPLDISRCKNLRLDGPTPCHHPHCDCMASTEKWDRRFLSLAHTVATWSKDPSTKAGACIVRDRSVVSLGFNGFPRGMSDEAHLYADRDTKLSRTVHAEVNAILNAGQPVEGCTMYITLFPCSNCALNIIQARIKRVVATMCSDPALNARWADSFERTKAFFKEAGVDASLYPE